MRPRRRGTLPLSLLLRPRVRLRLPLPRPRARVAAMRVAGGHPRKLFLRLRGFRRRPPVGEALFLRNPTRFVEIWRRALPIRGSGGFRSRCLIAEALMRSPLARCLTHPKRCVRCYILWRTNEIGSVEGNQRINVFSVLQSLKFAGCWVRRHAVASLPGLSGERPPLVPSNSRG